MKLKKIENRLDFVLDMIKITRNLGIKSQEEYWTNEYNELYKIYEKMEKGINNENYENGKTNSMDWI